LLHSEVSKPPPITLVSISAKNEETLKQDIANSNIPKKLVETKDIPEQDRCKRFGNGRI
jgi:hypothetical protein